MKLASILDDLGRSLRRMRFAAPVAYVYNPLEYARMACDQYIERFARREREALLLGMNPGPWGMVQTGIPFGEVRAVRDWLQIDAAIGKPRREHPKRLVEGLACRRTEVSGARLWGWARDSFEIPDRFFQRFFVMNYCPLAFLEDSGRNRTPDKLPAAEAERLLGVCDEALRRMVAELAPKRVIGVGAFAERRARAALAGYAGPIDRIPHPSPASPAANRDWAGQVQRRLVEIGIESP